jgi:hypothetical protein
MLTSRRNVPAFTGYFDAPRFPRDGRGTAGEAGGGVDESGVPVTEKNVRRRRPLVPSYIKPR